VRVRGDPPNLLTGQRLQIDFLRDQFCLDFSRVTHSASVGDQIRRFPLLHVLENLRFQSYDEFVSIYIDVDHLLLVWVSAPALALIVLHDAVGVDSDPAIVAPLKHAMDLNLVQFSQHRVRSFRVIHLSVLAHPPAVDRLHAHPLVVQKGAIDPVSQL